MSTADNGIRVPQTPRTVFANRFAELYEAAGNPTLKRVATAAGARMRAARAKGQGGGVSAQRISDWRAGRNVPAKFDALVPVLLTLIEEARKSSEPVPPALLDVREWQRIWEAAVAWTADADPQLPCPYPGLSAYRREDAALFFGRTRPTAELAGLVRATAEGDGGIVVLVGASGAGKSSLLAAGVAPQLAEDGWDSVILTPGARPLTALLGAIGYAGPGALPLLSHVMTAAWERRSGGG
ncbi:ATP-binding protein [Nocardia jiangxiensis]|uniref:AAA family ATPase n=1 Tax=Nocardia jiangxiensis TaxID=282685 RepID=A0ABW6S5M0_9NOCA|nr:ATP-binding protein [Nocardia jiangxiensis]